MAAGAAAVVLAALPATATSTAEICEPDSTRSYVCVMVEGEGRHVDRLGTARGKADAICNYRAVVYIKNARDEVIARYRSKKHRGCSYGRAWFTHWKPDRRFPNNSHACAKWWENGERQGGEPCARIYE